MHRRQTDAPSPQTEVTTVLTARFRPNCKWALKAHCTQGHPYSPENTYVTSKGHRQCRTCNRARDDQRRKNKERRKSLNAATRKWQTKHPDKVTAAKRRHAEANPGYMQKYQATHKRKREWTDADRQRAANYRKSNPQLMRAQAHTRRARKRKAPGTFTKDQWLARLAYHGWKCRYCDTSSAKLTIDHMIPLSRGGSNWPSNLVPACAHCNHTKHLRTFEEFISIQRK